MMFGRKNKAVNVNKFDNTRMRAFIRASICTGEQVGCYRDLESGIVTEIMLINDQKDLEKFKKLCGMEHIPKEY